MSPKQSKLESLDFHQTPFAGKKAAVYVRVSSNDVAKYRGADKERQYRKSVVTQIDDGVKFATVQRWKYEVYKADCNMSGFEDDERPDIQRIIAECRAGKIHTVLCRDPKRLTRNAHFGSTLLHDVFLRCGVNLVCYDWPVDIATPDGQESFLRICSKGQQELQYISKISRRNREALVAEGGWSGKPPYGYRLRGRERNAVETVPEQVEIVQEIFRRYDEGEGLPTIVRDLCRRKVKRIVANDEQWNVGDVARLLRKRQYIGEIIYNEKVYQSPYKAIVSPDVFARVQAKLETNGRRGHRAKNSPHLLTEIIKCGNCYDIITSGKTEAIKRYANLGFANTTRSRPQPWGYYRCQTVFRYGLDECNCPGRINAEIIEDFVRRYIAKLCVEGLPPQDTKIKQVTADRIAAIENTIATLNAKKARLFQVFAAMETAKPEDLTAAVSALNDRIEQQEMDMKQAESTLAAISNNTAAEALDALDRWDDLPLQDKRAALKRVLEAILVYPDRVILHLRSDNRPFVVLRSRSRPTEKWTPMTIYEGKAAIHFRGR